jgi:Na+-transporting NADH:ubiquinone oxidoreductase subunit C
VQQSNSYIIIFTAIMTLVVGGMLSIASEFLKPWQKKSIELDTKTSILKAVMKLEKGVDVLSIYNEKIQSEVVDFNGEPIELDRKGNPIVPEEVNVLKNFKMEPNEREYPVFKFMGENGEVEAYIFPVYGNGLWDKIWGFVALEKDMNTIKGVAFDHKAETPGLGQRIQTLEIQERYRGRKIHNASGEMVSVTMIKGEGKGQPLTDNQVDGMSGATLTGKGLNKMMVNYLAAYAAYMKKIKKESGNN